MNKIYTLTISTIFILSINNTNAQKVWTGPTITFTKANHADVTLEANQDRITSNVWLTRGNSGGLINIVNETESGATGFPTNPIPTDTEWAYGTTADYTSLTYVNLNILIGKYFRNLIDGKDIVLHLITDDVYIDIKFISWESGGVGGGFSYERSTDQTLSTNELGLDKKIKLFPNPSSEFIQVSGLAAKENYTIYNILGAKVKSGNISNQEEIDIRKFENGLYFLKFENGNTLKFLKK